MNEDYHEGNHGNVPTVKVGLVGRPVADKTTYISAIPLVALMYTASELLVTPLGMQAELPWPHKFRHGGYLVGTAAITRYEVAISGRVVARRFRRLFALLKLPALLGKGSRRQSWLSKFIASRASTRIIFKLDILDYPAFVLIDAPDKNYHIWDYFTSCDGFVLLFDPHADDNSHYLARALNIIGARQIMGGNLVEGKLAHRCAACVAKYDSPEAFEPLLNAGMISTAIDGVQYPDDPERAFDLLASKEPLLHRTIKSYFLPQRTAYFMTSILGFYNKNRSFPVDPYDYSNTFTTPNGLFIRGNVWPINVLEPLIWIYQQVMQSRQRR